MAAVVRLIGVSPDDLGGLTSGRPWLLLDGDESWMAVYERLRDSPPVGVVISSKPVLLNYLQAWRRADKPAIALYLTGASLLP